MCFLFARCDESEVEEILNWVCDGEGIHTGAGRIDLVASCLLVCYLLTYYFVSLP
jgi:hypothetical protein